LYKDIGIETWNSTYLIYKTYADTLYYDLGNSYSYYNSTDFSINDYATSVELTSVGNWSEDKSGYSTTTEANALYKDIGVETYNSTSNDFNETYADTVYQPIGSYLTVEADPLWTANSTLYSKITDLTSYVGNWTLDKGDYSTTTEANALYKDIGIQTWNETFALFNKTYADTLYYDLGNSYGYYNSTSLTMSVVQALGYYNTTQVDDTFITQTNEGNLNVNSSDYWDNYNDPTEIKSGDSELLDGYNSDFFAPLNTSLVGDFNFTGRVNFDGLWSEGGLTLEDGNIYAQTGYFYNITGLNVNELLIKENKELKEKLEAVEIKAGAVLNAKNKSNLKNAQALIQSVLDSAGTTEEDSLVVDDNNKNDKGEDDAKE